ncbi:MAG TPA: Ion transport 2 [Rhodobacteraceae bacterium]|jgi:hypothetical protein|nr:Ion transport 2 [Paracoccaceae bacterium]
MAMATQLFWGTFYLVICSVVHAIWLTWCVGRVQSFHDTPVPASGPGGLASAGLRAAPKPRQWRTFAVVLLLILAIVLSHTFQVWLWAHALHRREVLGDWNTAVCFSMVTYTALGYGDIVLGPGSRIFASLAAVTGLLNFGVSTAFLVATWTRVFAVRQE